MSYLSFSHSAPAILTHSTHQIVSKICFLINSFLITFGISANAVASDNTPQIWKEEKNGVTIYTDKPSNSSEPVSLNPNTTFSTPVTKSRSHTTKNVNQVSISNHQATWSITLITPTDEQAIRANNGTIHVGFSLSQAMSDRQRLQWIIDAKAPQEVTLPNNEKHQSIHEFSLVNLDRGKHSLQLQLLDNSGKIIAKTPLTVFYVLRHHINAPN